MPQYQTERSTYYPICPVVVLGLYLSALLILSLVTQSLAQHIAQDSSDRQLEILRDKVSDYAGSHPIEKVYVHFDKPYYVLGEDCWFKAYVVNGSDLSPTSISGVLYLDWIAPSGEVVKHQRLKVKNGGAAGDFKFDKKLPTGNYTVRAYTNWMRNSDPELFYSKSIQLFDPRVKFESQRNDTVASKIDLQFFPEGGVFVANIKTQMAFKAVDGYGRGVQVKGKIFEENGKFVTTIQSSHRGIGVFPFVADGRISYKVVLERGETFSLPAPQPNGLAIAVSNMDAERLLVRIQSTPEYKSSLVHLITHSGGQVYYATSLNMEATQRMVSIPKNELPEGIIYVTLFDAQGFPKVERKVFNRKDQRARVTVFADKQQYVFRDSVFLTLQVKDREGHPVKTTVSVSVNDADYLATGDSENIYTRLLLQSDLKGNVENPEWYFEIQSTERKYALDMVMLTHGWSRYNWDKILSGSPDTISFVSEEGMTLKGRIVANSHPVANLPFTLMIPQLGKKVFNIFETDSLGYFEVRNVDFTDSTLIAWRVINKKGAIQNAKVQLEEGTDLPPVVRYRGDKLEFQNRNDVLEKISDRYIKYGVWNLDNVTVLREVVVEAKKTEIIGVTSKGMIVTPDSATVRNRVATAQFVGRYALALPFVTPRVMPDGEQLWGIVAKGKFAPVQIVVDGFVRETVGPGGDPRLILNTIPIETIEYVAMSSAGIMIKTKDPALEKPPGLIERICNGYDAAREFYHPKYGPTDAFTIASDSRTTLYWNANVETDDTGKAVIKFYNSDATKRFRIKSEGIVNGAPVSTTLLTGN